MNSQNNQMELQERILKYITDEQGYVILLLGLNDYQPVKGQLWYQKEMFMSSRAIDALEDKLDFEPYFIGPHSKLLEDVLQQLDFYQVIEYDGSKILLTDLGKRIFKIIKNKRPGEELEFISDIKSLLNDMTADELLALIYSSIDESFIVESKEYDRIMANKERLAVKLYQKDKITLARAAEIAKMDVEEIMRLLKSRNLKIHVE